MIKMVLIYIKKASQKLKGPLIEILKDRCNKSPKTPLYSPQHPIHIFNIKNLTFYHVIKNILKP